MSHDGEIVTNPTTLFKFEISNLKFQISKNCGSVSTMVAEPRTVGGFAESIALPMIIEAKPRRLT